MPVVKVKNIIDDEIQTEDLLLTDPEIDKEYARSRLKCGDLLFYTWHCRAEITLFPLFWMVPILLKIQREFLSLKLIPGFVRYAIEMPNPKTFIDLHTLGVAVQGINLRDIVEK